jgi:hypothetical protein
MTRIVYIELVNKWGKNDYTNWNMYIKIYMLP